MFREQSWVVWRAISPSDPPEVITEAVELAMARIDDPAEFAGVAEELLSVAQISIEVHPGLTEGLVAGVRRATKRAAQRWGRLGVYSEQTVERAKAYAKFLGPRRSKQTPL